MRSRSTLTSEIQQLLAGEQADPRAAQGLFLVPLVIEVCLQLALGGQLGRIFLLGLAVVAVPTVGAFAIASGRASHRWTIWLPVLDIVALGVFRLAPETAVGVAVAFPAIWLGLQFGGRGVATTVVTVLGAFVMPTLVIHGSTLETVSRVAQVTLMAVISSSAVALTAQMWKAQAEHSGVASRRLARAMSDVIEQRRLTESIVTSVDIGLVALDAEGNYDSMNPRHRDFMALAYPDGHDGKAGQLGYVYLPDGVTPMTREQMPTVKAAQGESFRDYMIWVGQDPSERRALAVSGSPHFDARGQFAGAVLAYHDITDLVVAARIKDEFIASVSHELRTPLTSIIGYVDMILEDDPEELLPADVRHYLATVQRNARRLHRLVDDLLSTALHSVTTVLDLEVLDVRQLVEACALEAEKAATAAGHSFAFDADCAHLSIKGDNERLAQVFDNLFSNAVKYTPAGGHVSGTVRQVGDEAVIRVSDTGRGISESELDDVFDKFFRSSSVQDEAIPGVGLGLAITKKIVDAHDGRISVESRLGEGTTFEVRLPLTEPPSWPT